MAGPALKRCVVDYLVRGHGVSERRACRVVKLHGSNRYYRTCKDPRLELRSRMRVIPQTRVRYGYRRVHVLLKREGWRVSRKPGVSGFLCARHTMTTRSQCAKQTEDGRGSGGGA